MVVEGIANWASITQPNTRFEPKYCIDVVLEDDKANELKELGFTIKDKEGGPTITLTRKVNGPRGTVREAPALMDAQKAPLNCLVGNGSKVKVQGRPWEMNRNGQDFKGLELQAVQVLDLVHYSSGDGDEFVSEPVTEAEVDEL
tara:strand:+ start:1136 stop:1567 length:432 start_codon:yes stop_codon:yes gene_type:complete